MEESGAEAFQKSHPPSRLLLQIQPFDTRKSCLSNRKLNLLVSGEGAPGLVQTQPRGKGEESAEQ